MSFSKEDNDRLIKQLHRDEGARKDSKGNHVAYRDTLGILTIGYGHNCEANPVLGVEKEGDTISDELANTLFSQDLFWHVSRARGRWPWIEKLDPARQAVLYNMAFNLGIEGLSTFKNTLRFIEQGAYRSASENMMSSRWASQVGNRARRLARQMETGEWQ